MHDRTTVLTLPDPLMGTMSPPVTDPKAELIGELIALTRKGVTVLALIRAQWALPADDEAGHAVLECEIDVLVNDGR